MESLGHEETGPNSKVESSNCGDLLEGAFWARREGARSSFAEEVEQEVWVVISTQARQAESARVELRPELKAQGPLGEQFQ